MNEKRSPLMYAIPLNLASIASAAPSVESIPKAKSKDATAPTEVEFGEADLRYPFLKISLNSDVGASPYWDSRSPSTRLIWFFSEAVKQSEESISLNSARTTFTLYGLTSLWGATAPRTIAASISL